MINHIHIGIDDEVSLKIDNEYIVVFAKKLSHCEFKHTNGKIMMRYVRVGAQVGWSTEWEEVADLNKDIREEKGER